MNMGLVIYLIVGLILGALTTVLVKEAKPNYTKDIVLGLVGAIIGDLLSKLIFNTSALSAVTTKAFITVVVLSVIVIAVGRAFKGSESK